MIFIKYQAIKSVKVFLILLCSCSIQTRENKDVQNQDSINQIYNIDSISKSEQQREYIDSLTIVKIFNSIDYYKETSSFIRRGKKIHNFNTYLFKCKLDLCQGDNILYLLDSSSNVANQITMSTWYSSCEADFRTNTQFISDTMFKQVIEYGEVEITDSLDIWYCENTYLTIIVNSDGSFDTISREIELDTLLH